MGNAFVAAARVSAGTPALVTLPSTQQIDAPGHRGLGHLQPGSLCGAGIGVSLAPNGDFIITTNDNGFIRVVRAIPVPEAIGSDRCLM